MNYPYLTDEEVKQFTSDAKRMVKNGTINENEIEKYLQWENEQARPQIFSQWAASQPI